MAAVTDNLPPGVVLAYVDKPYFNRQNKITGVEIETDAGDVPQTYLKNHRTGESRPHTICRFTGTVHHPDAAQTGARSQYMYVRRADGRFEQAWYRDHTCLMAARGDTAAIETLRRLFGPKG